MDSSLKKFWPYLALAAAVVGTLWSRWSSQHGEKSSAGVAILFAVAAYSLMRFLRTDEGAEQSKETELNERIVAFRDTVQCQREQQVNMDRIILQLQQKLDYFEEMQKEGDRDQRTRVIQITKEVMQQQAWKDRAHLLEAEALLLKKENHQAKMEKQQLNGKILQITGENQRLLDNAKEIARRNDALCEKMKDLTAQLAEANCQLQRHEKLLRQREKDLQLKTEEAAQMARLIQEQNKATEQREFQTKDLELRFQRLQKDVEDLSKENCRLQCKLQAAELKGNELTCLLGERDRLLESLERKAGAQDKRNDQLEDEVEQLRGANEKLLCELKNVQEKYGRLEEANCKLQNQLEVLREWRNEICAGLTITDQILKFEENVGCRTESFTFIL
ncbi:golgin subfamily A member 6-like protein 25 [Macrobrachium rosenbergii]|uniref:golgin subfamily A member 6-like protein 25 n=1 Tax=Macrobrachium rosenbergii TaxID=79674 RepID=UPI0034D44E56